MKTALILKQQFEETQDKAIAYIEEFRSRSVRSELSKGCRYNVLPFENQLNGYKLNGKEIKKPIKDNNCFKYHFDEKNQLILKEKMSAFLDRFNTFKMYIYKEDSIETMYWSGDSLSNITEYVFENDQVQIVTCHAAQGTSLERYYYENDQLKKIHTLSKSDQTEMDTTNHFYYKEDGSLLKIIKTWAIGGSRVIISNEQIAYKKLEERLFKEMKKAIQTFSEEHSEETLFSLAFSSYIEHADLFLSAELTERIKNDFQVEETSDWSYNDFESMDLIMQPLDDAETEKVTISVVKAIKQIVETDWFQLIPKSADFRCYFFNSGVESRDIDNPKINKILNGVSYFK
ncbi:hypothetical protein IBB71_05300 [Listeria welshimeri]|uniref:hypothetical protein n=1 Tax=Listeria welshimeri TaxID=1643 RepID=UPI0018871F8A|nr:hypothetical protein [Listeria welshimeri]MBF2505488.1 hypothetical protein [Listeria welshimeri]MBF2559677.1 hypothetical protein [Listeria welshimeri]MBF2657909.1 hypothetical protein [Listeria welshimeri]